MNKYLALAKKVKALADQGEGGEKLNAEIQIQKLMKKHGFSLEDIEDEKIKHHSFKIAKENVLLFCQVAFSVIGKGFHPLQTRQGNDVIVTIKAKTFSSIEIENKFDFYLNLYKRELEVFNVAFIEANDLFPENADVLDESKMSTEERRQSYNVQKMMAGINGQKYCKQLLA